jgi:hypothetical protein
MGGKLTTLPTMLSFLLRPPVFIALMAGTLVWGFSTPSTDTLLARCESAGRSAAECRLVVLGR